jgi:hypothetical protein
MNTQTRWADWDAMSAKISGFIEWAEPAPSSDREDRYAIVRSGAIAWARVSPNPDVSVQLSSGRFYDTGDPNDHPEGAVEWCRASAAKNKATVAKLVGS